MLHIIRQVVNNDRKFRKILQGLSKTFYHRTVTASEVEQYISQAAGIDFSGVFNQYLRTTKIPVLEYKIESKMISYRWANVTDGFVLPVKIISGNKSKWISPGLTWKTIRKANWYDGKSIDVDKNFYIFTKQIE